jgi:hypothetical protein
MDTYKILVLMVFLSSPTFGQAGDDGKQQHIILAQSSAFNCGFKPLPKLGYEIGRCINGEWEQVSKGGTSAAMNCGFKPLPALGYEIGRCINGEWEQVSKGGTSSAFNCGFKPLPRLGYKIGRCINGEWEQVSK